MQSQYFVVVIGNTITWINLNISMKGSSGNYHEVLSVKSVSNFPHRYDTQQCARGAAKPQGSAKVCSSVHCMHLRWEVATFVIDDEQSIFSDENLKWCDPSICNCTAT